MEDVASELMLSAGTIARYVSSAMDKNPRANEAEALKVATEKTVVVNWDYGKQLWTSEAQENVTRHIFITGGVVSSLGKGLTRASAAFDLSASPCKSDPITSIRDDEPSARWGFRR